jgi:hypothetical protein
LFALSRNDESRAATTSSHDSKESKANAAHVRAHFAIAFFVVLHRVRSSSPVASATHAQVCSPSLSADHASESLLSARTEARPSTAASNPPPSPSSPVESPFLFFLFFFFFFLPFRPFLNFLDVVFFFFFFFFDFFFAARTRDCGGGLRHGNRPGAPGVARLWARRRRLGVRAQSLGLDVTAAVGPPDRNPHRPLGIDAFAFRGDGGGHRDVYRQKAHHTDRGEGSLA